MIDSVSDLSQSVSHSPQLILTLATLAHNDGLFLLQRRTDESESQIQDWSFFSSGCSSTQHHTTVSLTNCLSVSHFSFRRIRTATSANFNILIKFPKRQVDVSKYQANEIILVFDSGTVERASVQTATHSKLTR